MPGKTLVESASAIFDTLGGENRDLLAGPCFPRPFPLSCGSAQTKWVKFNLKGDSTLLG
jgi:hypothetical protein